MKRTGFTLIEVMVVIIIIGILATLGIPSYMNFVEDSKSRVCQNNLLTLKTALDVYVMEQGVVPADLSLIPAETVKRAFAGSLKQGGWRLKAAYAVVDMEHRGLAFADIITDLAEGKLELLRCPKDKKGEHSYGVFEPLINVTATQYAQIKDLDVPFIADIKGSGGTFSGTGDIDCRHLVVRPLKTSQEYANVIFNDDVITSVDSGGKVLEARYKGFFKKRSGGISPDASMGTQEKKKLTNKFEQSLAGFMAKVRQYIDEYQGKFLDVRSPSGSTGAER